MSIRRSTAARALLAAMLVSALAPSTASATAGYMYVFSSPHEMLRCSTSVHTRDGAIAESPETMVGSGTPGYFWLGDLPEGPDDDSPNFEKLVLRCWIRDRDNHHRPAAHGDRPYTIELSRDDSFWERNLVERDDPQRILPYDEKALGMQLRVVGDPQRPTHLEIEDAWTHLAVDLPGMKNEWLHYDLVTVPRLTRD